MHDITLSVILVIVAAVITLLLRAFPFMIFGGKRELPEAVQKTAVLLPTAIMSVLVIYCLRADIYNGSTMIMAHALDSQQFINAIAAAIAAAGVIIVHLVKRQTLLSIAAGTVIYMVLIRVLPLI